jgi:hypothetical protein
MARAARGGGVGVAFLFLFPSIKTECHGSRRSHGILVQGVFSAKGGVELPEPVLKHRNNSRSQL